jgi:hypothetical protein
MLLKAYNNGDVKIFFGDTHVFSFYVSPPLKQDIDKRLRLLRMRRRTKWEDISWGSQAKIRFVR